MAGATFSLLDMSELPITKVTPIVWPGLAAAIGVGSVRELPEIRDGEPQGRRRSTLTLACDYRILHGARAAAFLAAVKAQLERASGALALER
jgi:pyruvate dehydrogenase E2 component (dihydrolipoamide acetyltransferase)